jgi:hypothetical protein
MVRVATLNAFGGRETWPVRRTVMAAGSPSWRRIWWRCRRSGVQPSGVVQRVGLSALVTGRPVQVEGVLGVAYTCSIAYARNRSWKL